MTQDTPFLEENRKFVTSFVALIIGSTLGAWITDAIEHKITMMGADVLHFVGVVMMATTTNLQMTIISHAISVNGMPFRLWLCMCVQGFAHTCGEVDHTYKEIFFSHSTNLKSLLVPFCLRILQTLLNNVEWITLDWVHWWRILHLCIWLLY